MEVSEERDGRSSSPTQCAGLFGPCDNLPDPEFLLEDPDGKSPPVHRCRSCAEMMDGLMERIMQQGKIGLFAQKVEEAHQHNEREKKKQV